MAGGCQGKEERGYQVYGLDGMDVGCLGGCVGVVDGEWMWWIGLDRVKYLQQVEYFRDQKIGLPDLENRQHL